MCALRMELTSCAHKASLLMSYFSSSTTEFLVDHQMAYSKAITVPKDGNFPQKMSHCPPKTRLLGVIKRFSFHKLKRC